MPLPFVTLHLPSSQTLSAHPAFSEFETAEEAEILEKIFETRIFSLMPIVEVGKIDFKPLSLCSKTGGLPFLCERYPLKPDPKANLALQLYLDDLPNEYLAEQNIPSTVAMIQVFFTENYTPSGNMYGLSDAGVVIRLLTKDDISSPINLSDYPYIPEEETFCGDFVPKTFTGWINVEQLVLCNYLRQVADIPKDENLDYNDFSKKFFKAIRVRTIEHDFEDATLPEPFKWFEDFCNEVMYDCLYGRWRSGNAGTRLFSATGVFTQDPISYWKEAGCEKQTNFISFDSDLLSPVTFGDMGTFNIFIDWNSLSNFENMTEEDIIKHCYGSMDCC
ncbi:hypothetical protein PCE1_002908 [Barthelona sp. PCE]